MTLARDAGLNFPARMRVHSYAVWSSVVFTLNVFAFLLMGMQARTIVTRMGASRLKEAFAIAAVVVITVVIARMTLIVGFNRLVAWWQARKGLPEPATVRQAVLVGWCGMRGFVTLATAFALPSSFPHRDLVVLIAFSVVLATLVVQGLTLAPLIRVLKLSDSDTQKKELTEARVSLADAAIGALHDETGQEADHLRYNYSVQREAPSDLSQFEAMERQRALGLAAVSAERKELERLRTDDRIGIDMFLLLQEELDWTELTMLSDPDRRMIES